MAFASTRVRLAGRALAVAGRDATRLDRAAVSLRDGAIAATPVALTLGVGLAIGPAPRAVTAGAGAMLVGVAWRSGGGRPPLGAMWATTLIMALATFLGSTSGEHRWLHILLLAPWSYAAGLLVARGQRGAIVGTQAIIAMVVFGRFGQPAGAAAGLAALVLCGGAVAIAFAMLAGRPASRRAQREAVGRAYQALAAFAASAGTGSSLHSAAALDEADRLLQAQVPLEDDAYGALRGLVVEARRLRREIMGLAFVQARSAEDAGLPETGTALAALGAALLDDTLPVAVPQVTETAPGEDLDAHLRGRRAALAGQLRAAARFVQQSRSGQRTPLRRTVAAAPRAVTGRTANAIRRGAHALPGTASLHSGSGRHAARLGVLVPLTALLAEHVPLQRSYWMVVAAAAVLKPEFGATITRGIARILGTVAGAGLAGVLAGALHPGHLLTLVLVALLAWCAYTALPASFAAGMAFVTALVVFLLDAVAPDTLATASDRALDTVVGGMIGLAAWALWPTWSSTAVPPALAEVIDAERAYLDRALGFLVRGERAGEQAMVPQARRVRVGWSHAADAVERAASEPGPQLDSVQLDRDLLAAVRSLAWATHVLRGIAEEAAQAHPRGALVPLAQSLDRGLAELAAAVAAGSSLVPSHESRSELNRLVASDPVPGDHAALAAALDEIVDAVGRARATRAATG